METVVKCEKEVKKVLDKYNCAFKVVVIKDYGTGQETPQIQVIPRPEKPN